MQTSKEYLIALICKLDKILTLLTYYAFLSLVIAKLSDLKNSSVFWPTL